MTTPVDQSAPLGSTANGSPVAKKPPGPLYPSLEAWVDGYFTPMFLHRTTDSARVKWCSRWWDHAEVIARLTILWNGWEIARVQPRSKASWWLTLDHHLPLLLGLDGPLRNCRLAHGDRAAKHQSAEPPANNRAPRGWFTG